MMEMRVNPDYHALRVAELELTADYQMKMQEERERAREERELLREQRRAEQELAAERERLEKERAHYVSVLEPLRAAGDIAAADELAARLGQIEEAIEANDYRIANIRAGYVYVISNVGAFGQRTRRPRRRLRRQCVGVSRVPARIPGSGSTPGPPGCRCTRATRRPSGEHPAHLFRGREEELPARVHPVDASVGELLV